MIRTVVQSNLDVNNRISGEYACLKRAPDTGINRRNKLLRNGTAGNGVNELVALAGLVRLDNDLDVTVLTRTARLTLVLGLVVDLLADAFLISNLRSADVSLNLEFTQKSVNDYFEVQLAHSGDNGLTGFLIGVALEGRVFLGKLGEGKSHLLLTGLGLGLNSHADNRLGEVHRFKYYRMLLVAQCVTCGSVFKTNSGGNVA